MIQILPTQAARFRTFGWVQDPGNFRSLCDVAAIFDPDSPVHRRLSRERIPALVEERDGREALLRALEARPLRLTYAALVGTAFTPRSAARCNGIVQAAIPGQVRPFLGDWPADNFVRWAQAFGLIAYDYRDDTFFITPAGMALSAARTAGEALNPAERELLTAAILAYPPAVRILKLLSETEMTHLTKFELGRRLGFPEEGGFTSLPQTVLIRALAATEDPGEKSKMKADWDGSSDKYARMIGRWLEKLGLAEQVPKEVTVSLAGRSTKEVIGQAFLLTAAGRTALGRACGRSRHRRIPKNVSYEMMATKGPDREYLRTRRTYILKAVSEHRGPIRYEEIQSFLAGRGLTESQDTIRSDVQGLVSIGLEIAAGETDCLWQDEIADFTLPLPRELTPSDLTREKQALRSRLTHLSHEYLSLLDLAFDSAQNRLFELEVLELLTEECGFAGLHLGGSRRPDGIIYTMGSAENYGVIIDTKAYSGGYNLPISQADEMERYVRENQTRDPAVNPNQWWEQFGGEVTSFRFLFVSGSFKGSFEAQLDRISRNTGVPGGALNVYTLLECAERLRAGTLTREELGTCLFQNREFRLED